MTPEAELSRELSRTAARLRSLVEASRALAAALDVDGKLDVILRQGREVMEAERSSLFLYDPETESLWNRRADGFTEGQLRLPMGVGIAGHVARTGLLLNVPDAYADPRFNAEVDRGSGFRTCSVLCAPLFTHNRKLLGVLEVLNKCSGEVFTADDEALMEVFASHAAIALDTARLVEAFVEKQRIEEGLRLASEIQMAMLPRRFPSRREFAISARVSPAKAVGGDFYDFVESDDRLSFLVGDVSGKGVPSALFMAVAKTMFRATLHGGASPAAVMTRVNRELCRDNERAMFVTAFLGSLDLRSGELVFSNAGHNPPYRLAVGEGEPVLLTGGHGIAMGIIEIYEYEEVSVPLACGEGVYLYTDGVTDALDPAGEQFSAGRLEAELGTMGGVGAEAVVERTYEAVRTFVAGASPADDITVLCVRRGPT